MGYTGKKYDLIDNYKTKSKAQTVAKGIRKAGYKARVTKAPKSLGWKKKWLVWGLGKRR